MSKMKIKNNTRSSTGQRYFQKKIAATRERTNPPFDKVGTLIHFCSAREKTAQIIYDIIFC